MAQIKYLTVLPTNATAVENVLHDRINIKNTWKVVQEFTGIVYNFNNKNLVTFEDNFSATGDLPMAIYFNYETAAPTDNYFDP